MKISFLLAAILLFVICVTAQNLDNGRQKCLDEENANRRAVAKANGISNMRKLEYDKSMEANPMEGFKCPENWMTSKYEEGVWATNEEVKTAENALATKFACVQNEKCGKLLLTNTNSDQRQRKMGKAGTACSGKVEDGLCIESAESALPAVTVVYNHLESTESVASAGSTYSHTLIFILAIMIVLCCV